MEIDDPFRIVLEGNFHKTLCWVNFIKFEERGIIYTNLCTTSNFLEYVKNYNRLVNIDVTPIQIVLNIIKITLKNPSYKFVFGETQKTPHHLKKLIHKKIFLIYSEWFITKKILLISRHILFLFAPEQKKEKEIVFQTINEKHNFP